MRNLEADFKPIAPNLDQQKKIDSIRAKAKDLAYAIYHLVPGSREQSTSLSRLDEVVFWANAGVVRNDTKPDECPFCRRSPEAPAAWPDPATGPQYCTHSSHNPERSLIPAWAKAKI